ncbi:PREDICTED: calcineurin-binding protein cabin-1-like [Nicrophorus vespilloides]|uniref:Calcineurin-binding protein cabin-1-like n=1 Tax=Nicrophorus vespilloides TaxID=110193 RepID=A0ABM1ME71_NICVS|nr:PREDICTED: calcineurin-binding protein cabin-1-like [Nicrophorus vespilloides]
MLKFRALNTESSSDEDGPVIRKEAQEEIAIDLYNEALRLQCNNNVEKSLENLKKLLDYNIPQLESQGGLPKTMSNIKYSCRINIASIYLQLGDKANALENFLIASELDDTDVTLWYKIGMLALKQNHFRQSMYAFTKGLDCNDSHWPCLDQLISVLFGIGDTIACLEYISKALNLDPYYVKGIVVRKRIYENNPATQEYYMKFNPSSLDEPVVNVDITEEEENAYLEEIEKLYDRINEVEKSFGPKPLPVIPLPVPLEDYTWVALGKTLTGLHKYITDNNMSHLSKINMKKCMSNTGESKETVADEAKTDVVEEFGAQEVAEQIMEVLIDNVLLNSAGRSEEMDDIVERRMSTTSENDATTPIQTDENEEMEQDMDEQEDVGGSLKSVKSRILSRGSKRKRDLVSDLQIWGWHSKRKAGKKGKNDRDTSIENALTRIIPSHLLPNGINGNKYNPMEDSMSTMDLYNMHLNENKPVELISPIDSPISTDAYSYFGGDEEKADVKSFWTRNWENCDAIDLIEEFVYSLSNIWQLKWPVQLISIYIDAYNMFRDHCSHPNLFGNDICFEKLRKDALTTILYGELTTLNRYENDPDNEIHCTSVSHLTLLSAWDENWGSEYVNFAIRVHWLRCHLFKKRNENDLAITALQLVQELVNGEEINVKRFKLHLPNCSKFTVISSYIIETILSNLELIHSLSRLDELFNGQMYEEVANILKTTFTSSSNNVTCGKIGRPAQLGMLMHALWFTNLTECFLWTEECLNETLGHYLKPTTYEDKWEMVLEKCLAIMQEVIKNETVAVVDVLPDEKRNRLIECLSLLCARQVNAENTNKMPIGNVSPWIILHYILLRDEHRQQAKKVVQHVKKDKIKKSKYALEEEELPPSIAILFSAHEFLGPKGWCLQNQGELLHFMLDTIIYRLDAPIFEFLREKIDIHLEQAFFCLYQHPCKKNKISRHLADHNVNPLPLTWSRAQQLYEYFCPDDLPEFDSYKAKSISADLEQLLQRFTSIVPKEYDPQPLYAKIYDYIYSKSEELPKPVEFSAKIKAMYYLLGDYYFKQSECERSYKYYLLDLCISPDRIDSWAALSLGISSQLELKLNHCERYKTETEFLEKANSARVCFKEALKLNDVHITLWIEFGAFEYMVHSFCSRILKYDSEKLSMEKFEVLESEKDSYLDGSRKAFELTLNLYSVDQAEPDERWLYHYMIAKISEKKQEHPSVYLHHYNAAAELLHENKCAYPEKINYSSPQRMSVEALEVYYRMNASILKYLELHDGKLITMEVGKLFKKCLENTMLQKIKTLAAQTKEANKAINEEANEERKIMSEVKECMESLLKQVETSLKGDEVVVIDSDEEKKPDYPKIRVRTAQDIMDEMMRETMKNSPAPDNDVELVVAADDNEKMEVEDVKSEKSSKSEDENNIRKSTTTATEDSSSSSSSSSSTSSSDSESEDSSSSSSSSSDNSNENLSEAEILSLVDKCILGLEQCIRRLPQNYKALYRLAHVYYSYSKKKDLSKSKQLLLSEYKCKNSCLVPGLFSERKHNNFFNGIWRIPSSEVDRPGSLSAHMSRCVTLLLQVLQDTNDHKTLLELCLQLKKQPDLDKIYIRHSERLQLSDQALGMCIQSLRSQVKNITTVSPILADKLLVDMFKAFQKSKNSLPQHEKTFSSILVDAYKTLMGDKISDSANVLDMAIKYCQQSKIAEKAKHQQQPTQTTPKTPLLAVPPTVLPTPTNVSPMVTPMKRPNLGRPRGRPPGPGKSPRGRSPMTTGTNPFSWQNAVFNSSVGLDYLKQYQDELIKQYSQTITNQLKSQLGQSMFHAATRMTQPTAAAAAAANMLNPTNFVQTLQQMSGLNALATNQLAQSLSQMNPSLLNNVANSQLSAATSASQLPTQETFRQLLAMNQLPKAQKQPKVPKHSKSSKSSTTATGFKYPAAELFKTKMKDTSKMQSYHQLIKEAPKAHSSKPQLPADSTNLIKDRPNISIIPVAQPQTISPVSSSPGKTLQEKLADKQKQQKSAAAKSLDFVHQKEQQKASYSGYKPNVLSQIPKSLDVIPNFLMESGISISQVQQQKTKAVEISPVRKDAGSSKAPNNLPISLSVIKKQQEKQNKPSLPPGDDDDVIIIE